MPCSPERPILAASPAASPSVPRLTRQSSVRIVGDSAGFCGACSCGGRRLGGAVAACLALALVLAIGYAALGSRRRTSGGPEVLAPEAGPTLQGQSQGSFRGLSEHPGQSVSSHGPSEEQPEPEHSPRTASASGSQTNASHAEPTRAAAASEEVVENLTAMKQLEEHLKEATLASTTVSFTTTTTSTMDAEEDSPKVVHKVCKGGSLAACKCLLVCNVFGGEPDHCSLNDSKNADRERNLMLHRLIDAALRNTHDACEGMRCIVDCARQLECFDSKVEGDCTSFTNRTSQDHCQLNCEKPGSTAEPSDGAVVQAMEEEEVEQVRHGHESFHFRK